MWCKSPPIPIAIGTQREGLAFTQNQKIEESLNVWICHKDEMKDMKLGIVMKHRSLPFGEGVGGRGFYQLKKTTKKVSTITAIIHQAFLKAKVVL